MFTILSRINPVMAASKWRCARGYKQAGMCIDHLYPLTFYPFTQTKTRQPTHPLLPSCISINQVPGQMTGPALAVYAIADTDRPAHLLPSSSDHVLPNLLSFVPLVLSFYRPGPNGGGAGFPSDSAKRGRSRGQWEAHSFQPAFVCRDDPAKNKLTS